MSPVRKLKSGQVATFKSELAPPASCLKQVLPLHLECMDERCAQQPIYIYLYSVLSSFSVSFVLRPISFTIQEGCRLQTVVLKTYFFMSASSLRCQSSLPNWQCRELLHSRSLSLLIDDGTPERDTKRMASESTYVFHRFDKLHPTARPRKR